MSTESKIEVPGSSAEFYGTVNLDPALRLNGKTNLRMTAPADSFAWLQIALPTASDSISAQSSIRLDSNNLQLTALRIVQGDQALTGDLRLRGLGRKNRLEGNLTVTNLNLEKLLADTNMQTPRTLPSKVWSNAAIDLTPLRNVTADLNIEFTQANLYGLQINAATVGVRADNGTITISGNPLQLYRGKGTFNTTLDVLSKPHVVTTAIKLRQHQRARPALGPG